MQSKQDLRSMELTYGTESLTKSRSSILLNNIKMEFLVMSLEENMAVTKLLYRRFVEV